MRSGWNSPLPTKSATVADRQNVPKEVEVKVRQPQNGRQDGGVVGLWEARNRTTEARFIGLFLILAKKRPRRGTVKGRGQEATSLYEYGTCSKKKESRLWVSQAAQGGGGGDRTRVPRRFHGSLYVRSRMISAFTSPPPTGWVLD
jgi:hypothetical protein